MAVKELLLSLATDKSRGIGYEALKFPLFLLSLVYGGLVRILAFAQGIKPFRSSLKVISVGNITLGGTGKTVVVGYVADLLLKDGRKVAVLSRGYKKPRGGEKTDYGLLGDEPGMLKKQLPGLNIVVGPDRVDSLRKAAAAGCEAAILDDGLQQWRVKKDLEVVCIDSRGFGNECLLPRGLLREPLSALKRGHVFVLTNTSLAADYRPLRQYLSGLNPSALIVETDHEPAGMVRVTNGEGCDPAGIGNACLVCGIGNPDSFLKSCEKAALASGPRFIFSDHHRFSTADCDRIIAACRQQGIRAVVTTEKDAIRLPVTYLEDAGLAVYCLTLVLRIKTDGKKFSCRLRGLFAA